VRQDCAGWTLEGLLPAFLIVTSGIFDIPIDDNLIKTDYTLVALEGHESVPIPRRLEPLVQLLRILHSPKPDGSIEAGCISPDYK
jgi:hypothetical protein